MSALLLSDDDGHSMVGFRHRRTGSTLLEIKKAFRDVDNMLYDWNDAPSSDHCTWRGVACDNVTCSVLALIWDLWAFYCYKECSKTGCGSRRSSTRRRNAILKVDLLCCSEVIVVGSGRGNLWSSLRFCFYSSRCSLWSFTFYSVGVEHIDILLHMKLPVGSSTLILYIELPETATVASLKLL